MKKLGLILIAFIFSFQMVNAQKEKKVIVETNYGSFEIKLYNETPKHRDNFLKLVEEGFYNELLFHRVINDFMVQGGDPDSKDAKKGEQLGMGGPGYMVDAEFNEKYIHKKGALAAARNNNPEKKSSGSQFYIVTGKKITSEQLDMMAARNGYKYTQDQRDAYVNEGGTPHLDGGYTVFGEVTKGMEVIEKIQKAKTDRANRPTEDIWMTMKVKKRFVIF
jgi:peptidyl-prolyl cis-trans isomerase B (cyclophilin B)